MSDDQNDPRRRRAGAVPDAIPGEDSGSDTFVLDDYFGAEAAVPHEVIGSQPHSSRFPDSTTITPEAEEYESRVRARMSPVFSMVPRRRPPLEWMWKRYRRFAMRNRSGQVDDFGRDPVYAARIESVLDFLCSRYFTIEVAGLAQVPRQGPALLVCNHAGRAPWDAILLSYALQRLLQPERTVRTLIDDHLFYFPYLGVFLNRIGAVRACMDNGLRLLERQTLMAVFPESLQRTLRKTSAEPSDPGPFGPGGFLRLAVRTGAPLVPVGITCTEIGDEHAHKFPDLMPRTLRASGVVPRRSTWRFNLGAPIRLPDGTSDGPAALREKAEEVREIVLSLVQDKNQRKDFVTLRGRNPVAHPEESG